MENVFIIDDDLHIGDLLENALEKEGYIVTRAYSGTEALLVLKNQRPDIILLDLMLPGLKGEEVIKSINDIPVIIMSAKTDLDNKVNLLLNGAVDYVTKPFYIKELLARIKVHLKTYRVNNSKNKSIVFDEIELFLDSHTVKVKNNDVKLTRTEYAILKSLMENPTQTISKAQLLEKIDIDTPDCTESSIKVHISNLRKKLRDVGDKEYIDSVWGIGFKMKL